jgi:hypothetical protein
MRRVAFYWGLTLDFLIERFPFARAPAAVKAAALIVRQVSAIHERTAPHFKSAFSGCGHCAAHAVVGNGPE